MESSKLIIKRQEGVVKCNQCSYKGDFRYENDPLYHLPVPTLKCPRCGNKVNILAGKECIIKSVKMMI